MADDYLYVPQEQSQPSVLQRLWDARPWKDQINKPVDYTPLAFALGLLHPRLSGGGAVSRLPSNMPAPFRPETGFRGGGTYGADPATVPANQNGNFSLPGRLGVRERMRAYESYVDSLPPEAEPVAFQTFLRMQGDY